MVFHYNFVVTKITLYTREKITYLYCYFEYFRYKKNIKGEKSINHKPDVGSKISIKYNLRWLRPREKPQLIEIEKYLHATNEGELILNLWSAGNANWKSPFPSECFVVPYHFSVWTTKLRFRTCAEVFSSQVYLILDIIQHLNS